MFKVPDIGDNMRTTHRPWLQIGGKIEHCGVIYEWILDKLKIYSWLTKLWT